MKDNLRQSNSKFDEDIFLDYSSTRKAYGVYNHKNLIVKESLHVVFDESNLFDPEKALHGLKQAPRAWNERPRNFIYLF
jgi:hypothetical protein